MKKLLALFACSVSLAIPSAAAKNNQSWLLTRSMQVSLGALVWTGDLDDDGFNNGFVLGLDYYVAPSATNARAFTGVRAWFASESGLDVRTYGFHYGVRIGLGSVPLAGGVYLKLAGGYYTTEFDPGGSEQGFGGFAGLGYDMPGGLTLEAGFQVAPEVSGVANTSFYGVLGFRI